MYNHLEQIQLLMRELGPATPAVDSVFRHDDATWEATFSNNMTVLIEWVDHPSRLIFTVMLGRPAEHRRQIVCDALLSCNALWRESEGIRTAIGGHGGEAMLLSERYAADMSVSDLSADLESFAILASAWRDYVTGEANAETAVQDTLPLWGQCA